jgi:DNA-binding transcriptional LysR family regulator
MALGSTEAIKRVVAEGMGLAIVSRLAVYAQCAGGTLTVLPVAGLRRPATPPHARQFRQSAPVMWSSQLCGGPHNRSHIDFRAQTEIASALRTLDRRIERASGT